MTNEQANKIIRVLATEERVFGLEVDSLIREGAVHHVRVELSDAAQLQHIITRARQCPHVVRVEESSEEEFWAAPSHNPGY
jgi:hypothetical protein